jgi:hypothetical protein
VLKQSLEFFQWLLRHDIACDRGNDEPGYRSALPQAFLVVWLLMDLECIVAYKQDKHIEVKSSDDLVGALVDFLKLLY